MLPQELLTVVPQGVEVVTGQFALCQRLKRGAEVVRALKAQQGLFEIAPAPDLRWRTERGKQIKALEGQIQSQGQGLSRLGRFEVCGCSTSESYNPSPHSHFKRQFLYSGWLLKASLVKNKANVFSFCLK